MTNFGSSLLNAFWPRHDIGQRVLVALAVIVIPILVAVISGTFNPTLSSGVGVLSPLALMAAGQLTSFVFLANLRVKLAENARSRRQSEASDRTMADTAVVSLLAGTFVSVVVAVFASIIVVTATSPIGQISGIPASIVLTLLMIAFGVFVSCLPNLWFAYRQIVDAETERPEKRDTSRDLLAALENLASTRPDVHARSVMQEYLDLHRGAAPQDRSRS